MEIWSMLGFLSIFWDAVIGNRSLFNIRLEKIVGDISTRRLKFVFHWLSIHGTELWIVPHCHNSPLRIFCSWRYI